MAFAFHSFPGTAAAFAGSRLGSPDRKGSTLPRWKRPLDLILTTLALVMLLPLLLGIAVAVRLSGPGPVFYVQRRVGRGGRVFGMIKFRSMHVGADAMRAALMAGSDRPGLCFKMRDDPRVTRVGRILRRSSMDELPQLFNVLRGEMSLVGPHPALPEEVASYPVPALERLQALPGITGVWQVSGRAEVGFDEMVAMDVGYVRGATFLGDLRLLMRTVSVVANGRGAY